MTRRKRYLVAAAACVLAAVLTVLLWIARGAEQVNWLWGSLGSALPIATALLAWAMSRPRAAAETDVLLRRHMAATLAEHERLRGVHDPWPMPVLLDVAAGVPMDRWDVVRGTPGDTTPAVQRGTVSDIRALFDAIPSRRMVLVGPGGAGKSTAARRLAAALSSESQDDAPIPVIVPLALWDVPNVDLRTWLVAWMSQNLGPLINRPGEAEALLSEGRLLLILDGFDEIPARYRRPALLEINRALAPRHPLVVTSRPYEYAAAAAAGEVVRAAPAFALHPLLPDQVWDYLGVSAAPAVAARWTAVRDRVGAAHHRLLDVLAVPLFLGLARELYASGDRDPLELLDARRHADRASIERALLAAFLDSALGRRGGRMRRATARRLERAHRALRIFARVAVRSGDPTVASWRLHEYAPRLAIGGLFGVAVGGVAALGFSVFYIAYRPQSAAEGGLVCFALILLAVGGFAAALTAPTPRHRRVRTPFGRLEPRHHVEPLVAAAVAVSAWLILRQLVGPAVLDPIATVSAVSVGLPWLLIPNLRRRWQTDALDRAHRATVTGVTLALSGTLTVAVPQVPAAGPAFAVVAAAIMCGYVNHEDAGPNAAPRAGARPRSVFRRVAAWAVLLPIAGFIAFRPQTAAEYLQTVVGAVTDLIGPFAPAAADRTQPVVPVLAVIALSVLLGGRLATFRCDPRQLRRIAPRIRDLPSIAPPRIAAGAATGVVVALSFDVLTGFGDFTGSVIMIDATRGSVAATAFGLSLDFSSPLFEQFIQSAVFGGTIGFILAVVHWLHAPADAIDAVDHRSVVRADRRVFILTVVVSVLVSAVIGGPLLGPPDTVGGDAWAGIGDWAAVVFPQASAVADGLRSSAPARVALGLLLGPGIITTFVGVPVLLYLSRDLAWPQYRCAHLYLALTGRLPFRLARFLEQAHAAGILREVGGAYHFRHERLAAHLDPVIGPGAG